MYAVDVFKLLRSVLLTSMEWSVSLNDLSYVPSGT